MDNEPSELFLRSGGDPDDEAEVAFEAGLAARLDKPVDGDLSDYFASWEQCKRELDAMLTLSGARLEAYRRQGIPGLPPSV